MHAFWRRQPCPPPVAQVENVCGSPIVQQAWDAGQPLAVHGMVYSLADGLLKPLFSRSEWQAGSWPGVAHACRLPLHLMTHAAGAPPPACPPLRRRLCRITEDQPKLPGGIGSPAGCTIPSHRSLLPLFTPLPDL